MKVKQSKHNLYTIRARERESAKLNPESKTERKMATAGIQMDICIVLSSTNKPISVISSFGSPLTS